MNDVYICKIPLENFPGESIPVYSTWTDNSFSVNVFHKDRAWNKSVSEDDLKSLCGFTQKSAEEYLVEAKRALTCDGGCAEFTYSLIQSEFILKKIVDSAHNIKVKFGSLLLEKIPVSSFAEIAVDYLLNRCVTLKAKNISLKQENDDLRKANTSLHTHVCNITKLKTEMEEALYTKTLALLNAKKEKICELQQMIDTRTATSDSGHKVEGTEEDMASSIVSDLYGSDTELDTDENSDQEYTKRSAAQSSDTGTRFNEEDKELLPRSSKSQKFSSTSSSIALERLTKGHNEYQEEDDDDADVSIPIRRKKNVNSKLPR